MRFPDKFPFAPLGADDVHRVLMQCGGVETKKTQTKQFLLEYGSTLLDSGTKLRLLWLAGLITNELTDNSIATRASIYKGSLLHLATSNLLGTLHSEQPPLADTLMDLWPADHVELAQRGIDRMHSEQAAFVGMANTMRRGLVTVRGTGELHPHVIVGAGVMHFAVMQAVGLERAVNYSN